MPRTYKPNDPTDPANRELPGWATRAIAAVVDGFLVALVGLVLVAFLPLFVPILAIGFAMRLLPRAWRKQLGLD